MTLPEILKAIRQWWWILFICPIIAAGTAYFVSSAMTPVYEAEATVIVEHQLGSGVTDLQSIQAAERRTQTFSQLVTTRSVLAPTIENLELNTTVEELRQNVSFSHARETQLVDIAVQDPDPERAAQIANEITTQFAAYVQQIQEPFAGASDDDVAQALASVEEQIVGVQERQR